MSAAKLIVRTAATPRNGAKMTKHAFEKIADGLTDALAIARGEAEPSRVHVPPEMNVRAIRSKTRLSQEAFAPAFGFTVHEIHKWEQGRNRSLGTVRAYLMFIYLDPAAVLASLCKLSCGKFLAA